MQLRLRNLLYLFVITALFSSCSGFDKVRKSSDVNYKLTKANEYFEKKDYSHANQLYKELMPVMKSTRNYEALYFKYAYTFFYLKDYLESSYFFKNYSEYFPNSKNAEEAEFMAAVSLFRYTPKYTLDQTNTEKAMEALQSFVYKYPTSTRMADANKLIEDSRKKLEMKKADAAKLYFNITQYKAASVAYKSVLRDYPESSFADLYQFMIVRSLYKYAKASIESKQEERYIAVLSAIRELKDTYPQSGYLAEADKLNTETNNKLKIIRDEHK